MIRIRGPILDQMMAEARAHAPEECCGLLAGRGELIADMIPAPNALSSATEFEIAPRDLFRIFRAMRDAGLEHLGIYHSHPSGENTPSPRDIERAYYPDAAYFILSPREGVAKPVRAFQIRDGQVAELEMEVVRD